MRGLYAITDTKLTPYRGIVEFVKDALRGGAKYIQLRDKDLTDLEVYPYALDLRHICHIFGAKFIMNDRVELAKKVRADGIHVGRDDVDVAEIKKSFDGIVGVSCYGDLERAKEMEAKGADYVAFGSFFTSPTKPNAAVVDKDVINRAKSELKIPVCVIGGITSENAKDLVDRGADMVSVISDLWLAPQVEARAFEYAKLFKE